MARRVKISCVETSRLFQKISEEYGFTNEVVMSWMPLVAGNDKGATCHAPTDFRRGQACLTRISPTPFLLSEIHLHGELHFARIANLVGQIVSSD